MRQFIKKRSHKSGLPPGTLVHVGIKKTEKVKITVIDYDEGNFEEKELKNIKDCFPYKDKSTVTWINIDGVHQVDIIEKIGKHFNLHPLVLEDIVNTGQRPKIEDFDDYLFVVLKMLYRNENEKEAQAEQVSLIVGPQFVITFQERVGDVFNPLRERIRNGKGRIRKMGPDYLAYALIDSIVDNYFTILEKLGEDIEEMEKDLVGDPKPPILQSINRLKAELLFLRKLIWPLREVINGLQRGESSLIKETTGIYLRDVYDHTIQVIDTIETFRDLASGMFDTYLSSVSNRMNEVMKVLTIIATIFIPLTFIAGIYGMNFNPEVSLLNMPELNWKYGYVTSVGIMVLVALVMVFYFKRKKWF
jgi:magnesium transporter